MINYLQIHLYTKAYIGFAKKDDHKSVSIFPKNFFLVIFRWLYKDNVISAWKSKLFQACSLKGIEEKNKKVEKFGIKIKAEKADDDLR